ncbi:hypothetical protein DFH08DRAFT_966535 [Mycena albidolilacea]|uniref:Uncharacterized protein n=1 Tax=Mycena albidolilacea TaxID=1033008 RepID=A0AAD6ZPU2_9AGAR|nr:hypothetical protein DFH08DRAFT_966535 [Mycena albidolilacea]
MRFTPPPAPALHLLVPRHPEISFIACRLPSASMHAFPRLFVRLSLDNRPTPYTGWLCPSPVTPPLPSTFVFAVRALDPRRLPVHCASHVYSIPSPTPPQPSHCLPAARRPPPDPSPHAHSMPATHVFAAHSIPTIHALDSRCSHTCSCTRFTPLPALAPILPPDLLAYIPDQLAALLFPTRYETITSRCCWCTTVACHFSVGGTHAATSATLRVPCNWGSGLLLCPFAPLLRRIGAASSAGERLLSRFTAGVLCFVVGQGGVAPAQKWRCKRRPASPQLGAMAETHDA